MSSQDPYPSRLREKGRSIPRQDPVIHWPGGSDRAHGPLEASLVKQFETDGFLILEDLFSTSEVESFREELLRLSGDQEIRESGEIITEPDSGEVRSVFRIHENSPLFSDLAADPRLAGIAAQILNDELYIHQSRVNYKPGFRGREFYWHSDFETWHSEDGMPRMRALSMSIALTENFEYNGPLMLIPGSHKTFIATEGETPEENFKSSLKKQVVGVPSDDQVRKLAGEGGIVTATGKPGSVIIFDCNVMHGSNGNITPEPRSNVFFVYNAMSNSPVEPFNGQDPRPEYIATRKTIRTLKQTAAQLS
ncbi:ectoine hydroxylase [Salinispira pacifica]|uniref:Ectoine hydroxylase n=1 Tax=Salinispira pacifica TaxID=1307761 RepID=V5WIR8_9SPIO|nr:ectoine hydroxylase [Salinispira pacifica]AHC15505.1 Ectoine hydroxylase [Salinispira pacifica]